MQVEVLKDWGTYSKGDVIDMPSSTAEACIAHKVVKIKTAEKAEKEVKAK